MALLELFRTAFSNLLVNKLRSVLTLMGIIIGVGSVIVMVSIIEGAQESVRREFETVGSNLIFVVYAPERRATGERRGTFEGLTMEDADAIRERCPLVAFTNPNLSSPMRVRRGSEERSVVVNGVSEHFNDVMNVEVATGRSILPDDVKERARVCLIGPKVKENFFPHESPLGKELIARGVQLTVVGMLAKRGTGMGGDDRDNTLIVPLTVMHHRLLGTRLLSSIDVKAVRPELVEAAADQIWKTMVNRHEDARQGLYVDSQSRILEAIGKIMAIFRVVLGFIGFLSLLVGGIGIMNIMLVTVTERTREIGIRKAVGARQWQILFQFLLEAVTLSGLGGVIGIGFGWSLAKLVGLVMKEQLPTHVPLWVMAMSFSFACVVGVFFGIYPAYRAAQLDTVECLRYE